MYSVTSTYYNMDCEVCIMQCEILQNAMCGKYLLVCIIQCIVQSTDWLVLCSALCRRNQPVPEATALKVGQCGKCVQ